MDDYRNVCYETGISVKLDYHEPKIPKNYQPNANPARNPTPNLGRTDHLNGKITENSKKIDSFLYGKQPETKNKPKILNSTQAKPAPPPRKHVKQNIKYGIADTQPIPAVNAYIDSDEDAGVYIPPAM